MTVAVQPSVTTAKGKGKMGETAVEGGVFLNLELGSGSGDPSEALPKEHSDCEILGMFLISQKYMIVYKESQC